MSEAQVKEIEAQQESNTDESEPLPEGNEAETDEEEETVVVSFGNEAAKGDDEAEDEQEAAEWVKNLRKQAREDKKRIKELEAQQEVKTEEKSPLGAKPTMEGLDYDAEAYEKELDVWNAKKVEAEKEAEEVKGKQTKANEDWDAKQSEYSEGQKAFNADKFADAKDIVDDVLSNDQKTIMIHVLGSGAANLVWGLGSNKKELEALSKIKDSFRFSAAVARLESKMTVTKGKKPRNAPETKVGGNASRNAGDRTLKQLEAEAERTGNYTDVFAYKRKLRKS